MLNNFAPGFKYSKVSVTRETRILNFWEEQYKMTILRTTRNSVWLSEGLKNSEGKYSVAFLKLFIKHVHFSLSLNSSKHNKKKITATIIRSWGRGGETKGPE